jgi:hypothetical protein
LRLTYAAQDPSGIGWMTTLTPEEQQKKVKQLIATTDIVRLKSKQDNSEDDANIIKSFISKRVINNL